jgi:hypothetical protein
MSTVQAWQSAVQQLKQMRKLAGRSRQHDADGNLQAAAGVENSINGLFAQVASSVEAFKNTQSSFDEFEEVIVRLKVGRL